VIHGWPIGWVLAGIGQTDNTRRVYDKITAKLSGVALNASPFSTRQQQLKITPYRFQPPRTQQRTLQAISLIRLPFLIDEHYEHLENLIEKRGSQPRDVFEKLGLSPADVKTTIRFQVAWQKYCQLAITNDKIRQHYQAHQEQYDGTKLRASQIVVLLSDADDADALQDAKATLTEARQQITSGELTFADAARKYSRAPSRLNGGDVGWFPYRGKMPLSFTKVAFTLKPKQISEVVQSPFGLHLIQVTDQKAGDLSLEDCRSIIYRDLCQELYNNTAAEQHKTARIEYAPTDNRD